jgi:hypothetical protein
MGVHESQSLLWERMVALSKPFNAYLLPLIREAFPEVCGNTTLCLASALLHKLMVHSGARFPILPSCFSSPACGAARAGGRD